MSQNDSASNDRPANAPDCTDGPISLPDVLKEEYEAIFGPYPPPETSAPSAAATGAPAQASDSELPQVRKALNDKCAAALCLSGGGIRSATFALGIMQGLAKRGLMERFHYLSTVSGGGFIGSWLSAWIHNAPPGELPLEVLGKEREEEEPHPLRHLREFSNYLTPKMGLSSADTWTLAFIFVRNLILNWLVFLPPLAAALMLPRLMVSLVTEYQPSVPLYSGGSTDWSWAVRTVVAVLIAIGCGGKALSYMAAHRPSLREPDRARDGQQEFLWGCLAWLTAGVIALALAYAWSLAPEKVAGERKAVQTFAGMEIWWWAWCLPIVAVTMLLNLVPWYAHVRKRNLENSKQSLAQQASRFWWELLVFAFTGALAGFLLWALAQLPWLDPVSHARAYAVWAVPAMLGILLLNLALTAGLLSIQSEDEDREWWARAGGWILIVILGWLAISIIVLFAPSWMLAYLKLTAPAGLVATISAAFLGHSGSTPATEERPAKVGISGLVKRYALAFAAPIAIVFILILLALATDALLSTCPWVGGRVEALLTSEAERDATLAVIDAERRIIDRSTEDASALDAERQGMNLRSASKSHLVQNSIVKRTPTTLPIAEFELRHLDYHERIVKAAHWIHVLILAVVLFGVGWFVSYLININKFSLQTSWRNRLVRAYLGASRPRRTSSKTYDRFTGFDPKDNIRMWDLWYGPVPFFRRLLIDSQVATSIANKVIDRLEKDDRNWIRNLAEKKVWPKDPTDDAKRLDDALNALLKSPAAKRDELLDALGLKHEGTDPLCGRRLTQVRRRVIDTVCGHRRPLHVINMALNLVSGADLAWQQRKAESFTATTLHCGSGSMQYSHSKGGNTDGSQQPNGLGYRSSARYGGADRKTIAGQVLPGTPISLGTAMGLSGAAVNPNMGSHSSPAVTFLLTLFNVRVGGWLGNPGVAGNRTYASPFPTPAFMPMLREAFGLSDDQSEFVMLSDGGHFENLGLYEMIRRQCRVIFVSDAGQDPPFTFDDLGNAVRKVYIDMGVPIDFDGGYLLRLRPRLRPDQKKDGAEHEPTAVRCALARIRYSALPVSPRLTDGYLVYVKPTFYGDEPIDVYNFAQGSADFPHETTADQFFSESQFESYRRLGEFIIDQLFKEGVAPADTGGCESFPILAHLDPQTFVDPHPFWVEPPAGKVGDTIKIRGLGFQRGTNVRIGGIDAKTPFVSDDGTMIEVDVPAQSKGTTQSAAVDVVIIPPGETAGAEKAKLNRLRMRDAFLYTER